MKPVLLLALNVLRQSSIGMKSSCLNIVCCTAQYVEESSDSYTERVCDEKIGKLHDKIRKLKESREWEARYMTFEELLQDSEEKGKQEGKREERQKLLKLIGLMSEGGDAEYIPVLTKDEMLLEQMYKKYQL